MPYSRSGGERRISPERREADRRRDDEAIARRIGELDFEHRRMMDRRADERRAEHDRRKAGE